MADDAVVVDCAADGLKQPPLVPIWDAKAITLRPIRAGFPRFGAALAGYVEATRTDGDKNTLCPPSSFGNSLTDWARTNVLGMQNSASYGSQLDISEWTQRVALNPARIPPERSRSAALDDAPGRRQAHAGPGVSRLAALSGNAPRS